MPYTPDATRTTAQLLADILAVIYQNTTGDISGDDAQQKLMDLAASLVNRNTDRYLMNLREYDAVSRTVDNPYRVDECCVRLGTIYKCTTLTYGAWDAADWTAISSPNYINILSEAQQTALTTADPTKAYICQDSVDGGMRVWDAVNRVWTKF